jgi:hypothetical protein
MSLKREAIWSAVAGWRRGVVTTCLALATTALACLSFAADAASAAGATTVGPSTGPSVGSTASQASLESLRREALRREALRRAAAAAGRSSGPKLSKLSGAGTTTTPATAVPPASVYTGPIRPPPLGNGALGRAGTAAKHQSTAKSGSSTVAIVVGALGALLVLACAAWALARRRAYEPHWWLSLQHSLGEAGYRTSSTWAEFSDWARRGG